MDLQLVSQEVVHASVLLDTVEITVRPLFLVHKVQMEHLVRISEL